MVDIHTHILPAMDDGAPDLDTAVEMLAMAEADGVTVMAATPHANQQYAFDPERCQKELARIAAAYPKGPQVCSGCEVHLTPENLEAVIRTPARFTLNAGDCLLVELPDPAVRSATDPALRILLDSGLRPVIAHPERNVAFQSDPGYARQLMELGIYFQLTASAITGSFGPEAMRSAGDLLKRGLVHMVSSDAHGTRQRRPLLSAAHAEVARRFGTSVADLLFIRNPLAALNSMEIAPMQPVTPLAGWFRKAAR